MFIFYLLLFFGVNQLFSFTCSELTRVQFSLSVLTNPDSGFAAEFSAFLRSLREIKNVNNFSFFIKRTPVFRDLRPLLRNIRSFWQQQNVNDGGDPPPDWLAAVSRRPIGGGGGLRSRFGGF